MMPTNKHRIFYSNSSGFLKISFSTTFWRTAWRLEHCIMILKYCKAFEHLFLFALHRIAIWWVFMWSGQHVWILNRFRSFKFVCHVLKDRFSNRKQACCEYAFLVSGLRLGCCAYNKLQLCLFLVYSVNFRWFSCGCLVIHPLICFELSPEYCARIHKFWLHESFVGLSNDLLSDLGCQRSGYCDFGTVCSFGQFAPILYLV